MIALRPPILIVEDDIDVCAVICTMLIDKQYRVITTNEYSTGVEILENLKPALLIADVVLQGLGSGADLATIAREKNIPILLMTGEPNTIKQLHEENIHFLQKPFRINELNQWIENILSE